MEQILHGMRELRAGVEDTHRRKKQMKSSIGSSHELIVATNSLKKLLLRPHVRALLTSCHLSHLLLSPGIAPSALCASFPLAIVELTNASNTTSQSVSQSPRSPSPHPRRTFFASHIKLLHAAHTLSVVVVHSPLTYSSLPHALHGEHSVR